MIILKSTEETSKEIKKEEKKWFDSRLKKSPEM